MRDVEVARGGQAVLRGLSFDVAPGEVFALLGGNGAGKSTTLLTCLGLLAPSSGSVTVLGACPQTEAEWVRRGLAYLPEHAQLYPHLDARENLSYFLRLAGLERSGAEVDAALDVVGLDERARSRRLADYSKGMRQKVAIALALLRRTPLLLLDEPTSGLDPLAVEEFDALVHTLGQRGVAVLMVTHDLFGACRVASRLGVLHGGRLVSTFEPAAEGGVELDRVRAAFAEARAGAGAGESTS
jgi:ABC-2 type transport system ATP-binding protein